MLVPFFGLLVAVVAVAREVEHPQGWSLVSPLTLSKLRQPQKHADMSDRLSLPPRRNDCAFT